MRKTKLKVTVRQLLQFCFNCLHQGLWHSDLQRGEELA